MSLLSTVLVLASSLSSANAYGLKSGYNASNFFDPNSFAFYNGWDTFTNGFALYQPKDQAMSSGLTKITNDQKVYIGVDTAKTLTSTTPGAGNGRSSVRLEGTSTFDNGLFIADFDHLPANACGQWPAFWLLHDDGDGYSEIDIVENVSYEDNDSVSIYTDPLTCVMKDNGGTGTTRNPNAPLDCALNQADGGSGCGADTSSGTFGASFNQNKGGFWATQVESDGIKVWYFARANAPADITSASPDPTGWGKPMLNFGAGNCDVNKSFKKMKIIINITFCGAYAGADDDNDSWNGFTGCGQRTNVDTCETYVANNPQAFQDVYFLINSVKVFQKNIPAPTPGKTVTSTKAATSTLKTSTLKTSTLTKMASTSTRSSSTTKAAGTSTLHRRNQNRKAHHPHATPVADDVE